MPAKKSQPTIGLAMIVREYTEDLEPLLKSLDGQVDQIVIVTTQKPHEGHPHFPWVDDFAAARNFSFDQLTTDWLFWLDDDDEVRNPENIRQLVAEAEAAGNGCVHLLYEYRHDDMGRPTVLQTRERLVKRSVGWKWMDRVHEYLQGQTHHTVGYSEDVVIVHHSEEADTERNMRLLQMAYAEDPQNPRIVGALGDTYQSIGEWSQSIPYMRDYFVMVGNQDSKWTAATDLARSYMKLEDWQSAEQWCFAAISQHPEYSLPFLLLAAIHWFGYKDSGRALRYLADADTRAEAPLVIHRQPNDYTLNRWDVEHRIYADQGDFATAQAIVSRALEYLGKPAPAWEFYGWWYLEQSNSERSVNATMALVDHLYRRGDTLTARELLKNLPVSIRTDERIVSLGRMVERDTAHVFDDDLYAKFYEENHGHVSNDNQNQMNAVTVETYRMEPLLRRLKMRGAKRVLDVGCGAGEPAIWLAKHGFQVVGLDVNKKALAEARRRAKKSLGPKAKWSIEFRHGTIETAENLGKFDAVVMMELIEHVHPSKVPLMLGYAEDVLSPGGAVFLTTPGMTVGDIPGISGTFPRDHVKEFTRAELEGLLANYPGRRAKLPMSLYKLFDREVPIPGFGSWFMEYECWPEEAWKANGYTPAWDKPVAIYVGPGLEDWNAFTPDEHGLGGSETWAAKTARAFRDMGHPVVVYGMVQGVWDGVIYRDYNFFNPEAPFAGERAWLCVVSRYVEMLDTRPNAENVFFVAHDVDYGEALTPERLANLDKYLVLSQWHFSHTMDVYLEQQWRFDLLNKLGLFRNAIKPEFYMPEPEVKQKHSFIWSSSPDRGLDQLLEWWPRIREMWPDATLNIYYGWDNIDAMMATRPWLPAFKARVQDLARQDGVTWNGRIGQRELAKRFAQAQFWLYPSQLPGELGGGVWNETFCITALEAQMAGCIPIMPSVGALPERLYYGSLCEDDSLNLGYVLDELERWDENPPEELLVVEAQDHIAREYNWRIVTERLAALLGEGNASEGTQDGIGEISGLDTEPGSREGDDEEQSGVAKAVAQRD